MRLDVLLLTNILCSFVTLSHCAVTSRPVMWRVVGHIHDFLNGASFYIWIYQVSI